VFFLLPDKNKITYINIFQHLVNSCSYVGVDLKIVVLYLNYEIAVVCKCIVTVQCEPMSNFSVSFEANANIFLNETLYI
jgi:hypothetical protein